MSYPVCPGPNFNSRIDVATHPICAAILAAAAFAAPAGAQSVEKHANTPAGLILQSVTVKPGATTLYLSGQLAAPLDPASKVPATQLTMAYFGDTKTQTMSVLNKIRAILKQRGYAMGDVIKLTVFVAGDAKFGGKMDFAGMNDGSSITVAFLIVFWINGSP